MSFAQKAPDLAERPWSALPPELAAALRPGVPGAAEEMIDAIRAAVPAYARPLEGAFGEAIRTGVEQALLRFLDEVEGKPAGERPDRDIFFEIGRGEVREGRDLEALLAAYHVGARVAWRRTSEAAREAGFGAETLSQLAEAIFAYIDTLSASSVQGYAEEQSAVAGEEARRRRALLVLLLQGPPADPAGVEAAAREARWRPPERVAALVWGDESERAVARRLPLGSLAAPLDDGLVCALVPDPAAPGRSGELERALGRRQGALGPDVPWREAWRSARRARAVHDLISDGVAEGRLVVADEHLAQLIVHGDPELAAAFAERRLRPLAGLTPASREKHLETLTAWLDHQGGVRAAASALHVHPQTVRYRLDRLRELFGDQLDDPEGRFELALAVRAARADGARA